LERIGSNPIKPIYCFHGFWGSPQDFDAIPGSLAVDYTHLEELSPEHFLSDWGQNFFDWKLRTTGAKDSIVAAGYSQGGRLLLNAFQLNPQAFEKLYLISVNPGLRTPKERELRLQQDRKWAQKFRHQEHEDLIKEWNAQTVFGPPPNESKSQRKLDRDKLALALENWSLAHQQDFRELLKQNLDRIVFILGENDKKYVELYQEFGVPYRLISGSYHRVLNEKPEELARVFHQSN